MPAKARQASALVAGARVSGRRRRAAAAPSFHSHTPAVQPSPRLSPCLPPRTFPAVSSASISNVDTAGEGTAIEVGGKLIVVESDGTVIISGNDALAGPAPAETAEVEYLSGEWT